MGAVCNFFRYPCDKFSCVGQSVGLTTKHRAGGVPSALFKAASSQPSLPQGAAQEAGRLGLGPAL